MIMFPIRFGRVALSAAALLSGVSAQAQAQAQAQAVSGEQVFKQRCQACHSIKAGAPAMLAPTLISVVGRKAAMAKFNYTPALKASKITWTKATLDTFLAAPGKMVPGTRMVINLADPAQRAAVIAYLATIK
jgi:cytochrome c